MLIQEQTFSPLNIIFIHGNDFKFYRFWLNQIQMMRHSYPRILHTCSMEICGEIPFQKYVSEGICHRVFYDDLGYKQRSVKCECECRLVGLENSQTPSTAKVRPSDHREDVRSCALPFYSLVKIFPEALHSN